MRARSFQSCSSLRAPSKFPSAQRRDTISPKKTQCGRMPSAVGRMEERMYPMKELKRSSFGSPWTMKPARVSAASSAQYLPAAAIASRSSPRALRRCASPSRCAGVATTYATSPATRTLPSKCGQGVEEKGFFFVEEDGMDAVVRFRRRMGHRDGPIACKVSTRTHISNSPEESKQ